MCSGYDRIARSLDWLHWQNSLNFIRFLGKYCFSKENMRDIISDFGLRALPLE